MQYTVNRGEKGRVEIKVDVPKAVFEEAYEQILSELGKDVNIAGFRPGKVPRDILIGHVGSNKVLNQAASFLISKHLREILEKEKFFPIDSPKIAIESLTVSAPFSFVASFTQKPDVKIGDWKKIKIKKVTVKEIGDNDIEESIKNIFEAWRKQKSQSQSEKSKIANTEGTESTGKFIYDARGNKIFIKDEESKSKVESPSTNAQDEIDDNFARAIGARDLAHLREIVRRDLETIVADSSEAKFEQEIFDKILELGGVEVPEILVEDELNRMLVRLNAELERQGSTLEKYLDEQKLTLDQLKAKWRDQAEKNVKISLILEQIGRDESIKVIQEEIDKAMAEVNQTNLSDDQKQDLEKYIVFSIFQAKTLVLVKKTVNAN